MSKVWLLKVRYLLNEYFNFYIWNSNKLVNYVFTSIFWRVRRKPKNVCLINRLEILFEKKITLFEQSCETNSVHLNKQKDLTEQVPNAVHLGHKLHYLVTSEYKYSCDLESVVGNVGGQCYEDTYNTALCNI